MKLGLYLAEKGLTTRTDIFSLGTYLFYRNVFGIRASVAELVDAVDSKSTVRKDIPVQVWALVPLLKEFNRRLVFKISVFGQLYQFLGYRGIKYGVAS